MASEKQSASKGEVRLRDLPGNQNEMNETQWSRLVARAWSDEAFKKRLLTQPAAVLKEEGLEVPEGLQIKVVENTDRLAHLIFPLALVGRIHAVAAEDALSVVGGGETAACGCNYTHCKVSYFVQ